MSLFDGVEGFTPAFTGQEIANQTGSGAAGSWSSGMNAGSSRENADTERNNSNYLQQAKTAQVQQTNDFFSHASQFGVFGGGGGMGM